MLLADLSTPGRGQGEGPVGSELCEQDGGKYTFTQLVSMTKITMGGAGRREPDARHLSGMRPTEVPPGATAVRYIAIKRYGK